MELKNCLKSILFFLAFIIISASFLNLEAKAEDKFQIKNWKVEAKLLDDGSLDIKENITYEFSGKFNGVFREVSLKKTDGISDIKIWDSKNGDKAIYKKVDKGSKGDVGVYELENKKNDYVKIKVYSPSKNEQKTFNISYKVNNVAIKYNDVGELFYNFLGTENTTPVDSFTANIDLPYPAYEDKVKIFGRIPSNGLINFTGKGSVVLHGENVPDEKILAARLIFPKEYIPNSRKIVNEEAYSRILSEEKKYSDDIKNKIERAKKRKEFSNYGSIAFTGGSAVLIVALILAFRRKVRFNKEDFYIMLPEDCTPAVASIIYSSYLGTKDIISTILDLCRKGYLRVENFEEDILENEHNKTKKKKYENYKITKIKETDDLLLNHEKFFIEWAIDKMGNGTYVTLEDIKSYSKKDTSKFTQNYNKWIKFVKEEVKGRGYFDERGKKYALACIVLGIIELTAGCIFTAFSATMGIVNIILGVIFIIWGIALVYRKSDYGYIEYIKWAQFRKYLKKIQEENIQTEFSQYPLDEYLIYGISLGLDDKIIKKFKPYIETSYDYNNNFIFWYFILYSNNKATNPFNDSINSAFGGVVPSTGAGGGTSGSTGGAGGGGAGAF